MDDKIPCATTDSIEVLGFNVRVRNALRRTGFKEVGELIEFAERGEDALFAIRNMGEKGVAEIQRQLAKVTLIDATLAVPDSHSRPLGDYDSLEEVSANPQIILDLGPPMVQRHEVVGMLQTALRLQISADTLHPEVSVDGKKLQKIVDAHPSTGQLYETLFKIMCAPSTVSQELEQLFRAIPARELDVLIRRFGFKPQTLEAVASVLGVTRERVRQLQVRATQRIRRVLLSLPLIRIRSAFLCADNMHISFDTWSEVILRSGLLGCWTEDAFERYDQLEMMIVIQKLSEDTPQKLNIPKSLEFMISLRRAGRVVISGKDAFLACEV